MELYLNYYHMSDTRQNFLTVLTSIAVWTEEKRRGFTVSELAEHTYGVSERTVRRCVRDLQQDGFVKKRDDGLYYPLMTIQPSIFHP
jgi:DNA-binding IclR family transcriptional regulator